MNYINKKIIYFLLLSSILLLPSISFGGEKIIDNAFIQNVENNSFIFSNVQDDTMLALVYKYGYSFIFSLAGAISMLVGLLFLISGVLKLKLRVDSPNDPRGSSYAIIMTFLASALLLNPMGTSQILMETMGDESGQCYVLDCQDSLLEDGGPIKTAIEKNIQNNEQGVDKIVSALAPIFMILQIIGFVILISSIIKIKIISENPQKGSIGEVIIKIIGATALLNITQTINIIIQMWESFIKITN